MINRLANLSKSHSFFLFGARGTGKSTLLKARYSGPDCLYIDLLDPFIEDLFRRKPQELRDRLSVKPYKWVVIDEIQKLPKLLDLVQQLMGDKKLKFILSGSSSRKLKRGSANLLAGRAFVFHLYPFTSVELGKSFSLQDALEWGTLPAIFEKESKSDRVEFLRAYTLTYLKEEIQVEQLVRKLDPFRSFLEIAAQMNSEIVNFSKIGRDVGADTVTIQNYFSILEETLIGFFLPSYHKSVRKRQKENPKFYFFDTGVPRAISGTISSTLVPKTFAYGKAFEHFIILEIKRLADYSRFDWRFFYLRTKDNAEIDLIIERPGKKTLCIEIKSTESIDRDELGSFLLLSKDIPNSKSICLSQDKIEKKIDHINCYFWKDGLKEIGL